MSLNDALFSSLAQVPEEEALDPIGRSWPASDFDAGAFRAYDIRGPVDPLLPHELVYAIGVIFGQMALKEGQAKVFVARDGRLTGPRLKQELIAGLRFTGIDVIDLGCIPTPLLYYATKVSSLTSSGIVVTASHNPKPDNGFKIVLNGSSLTSDQIQEMVTEIRAGKPKIRVDLGQLTAYNIQADYITDVVQRIHIQKRFKVVLDAGNGATADVAPALFHALGMDVIPLFCEVDGHFPNHHPDPNVSSNLAACQAWVKKTNADLGLAFDGDGDRLGVVTKHGQIIWPDQLLMLFAADALKDAPGRHIVFDVKCTSALPRYIKAHGGKPIMTKTGHAMVRNTMLEEDALLAGELSGHLFFRDNWYGFDDGMYAGVRFLEWLGRQSLALDDIFDSLPKMIGTEEIRVACDDHMKFAYVDQLTLYLETQPTCLSGGQLNKKDGIRVDWKDAWILIRASNTTPALTLRFEADNEALLKQRQVDVQSWFSTILPDLTLLDLSP